MKKNLLYYFLLGFFFFSPATAMAATLSISSQDATVNRGCDFSVDVIVDTQGKQTNGTDAVLIYDPQIFTASSIQNGTIYNSYPGNNIDARTGKVNVSGLSSLTSGFAGKGTLVTVLFTVNPAAKAAANIIRFDFDVNNPTKTTDSNIVDQSSITDILTSVTNGNYTIGTAACGNPSVSKQTAFASPTASPPKSNSQLATIFLIIGAVWVVLDLAFLFWLIRKRG